MTMSRPDLRDALRDLVLLCDGGMGSRVQAMTLDVERDYGGQENCTEILNLTRPDIVREIHRGYFAAGADMVQTNSFGGSPVTLDEFGLGARAHDINRIAAELAREAADGFADPLLWPCEGRISGVFGSQRILNGEPRAPHLGIDIAVPTGTPVRAALGGRVALAADLYFNGLTVILDHGHAVTTTYSHLSAFRAEEGAEVAQGEVLALSGATGRVTGPHLDFRLHWFDRAADPLPLLGGA
jgi:murein DD-endopeptidase MepM/ murein hydrolase activator NlpD